MPWSVGDSILVGIDGRRWRACRPWCVRARPVGVTIGWDRELRMLVDNGGGRTGSQT